MLHKHVTYEEREGVAIITLHRPDQLNALHLGAAEELAATVHQASADEAIRAILITGFGHAFSTGGDLKGMLHIAEHPEDPDNFQALVHATSQVILEIRRAPKPVVAGVNGTAAGSGLGIVLACDMRVAVAGCQLVPAFLGVGLSPDSGTSFFLPRLVGLAKATELFFLNRPLSVEAAYEMGLVYKVVAPSKLQEEAYLLAASLARGPTQALARTKKLLEESFSSSFEEHLQREAGLLLDSTRTGDFREGVRSFVERRNPRFAGV